MLHLALTAGLLQGKEVWLLRVKGFDSPEAADMLKGLRLLMPASERPDLDSDEEFYVQELIGMQVGNLCLCHSSLLSMPFTMDSP